MNASKYLHSQKGKVIESMKIAYLSGKHIMVVEKLEDNLLNEIIRESSIIPYKVEKMASGGFADTNSQISTIEYHTADEANFIPKKLQDFPKVAKLFVYKCKDTSKSVSPQVASSSSLPELSLNNYLEHLSGLSSLLLQTDYPQQYKSLCDSIILLVTNTSINIPAKYAPYTEYITVPFMEFKEFSELASSIISTLDNIPLGKKGSGYALIDKTDAEEYLRHLYNSMKGLNSSQIKTILSKAKVLKGSIYTDNSDLRNSIRSFIREEANSIISLSKSISIIDTSNAAEPAGLGNMSKWIGDNKDILNDSSRYEFMEMNAPKGILVSGVPGTGKSMMAKYIAKELGLPLVRFDLGDLLGGYVGDSERNMCESLVTIDALAPCVVWVDEMEKAFSSGSNAHETTKRLIGKFLTWMQEKKSNSFVFATANDISSMPPEMFRSGRFDEKFYTFLPCSADCGKIFESSIKLQNKNHRRRTANNLEAKPLFADDINANLFIDLLEQEGLCIKEKQALEDENISRKNKFFIGSDIAKLIEDAKARYIRGKGFTNSFDSNLFTHYLTEAIKNFKSYGETNLDDVATCYSKLAHINFTSACEEKSVILPFEGYDELECSKGNKLYNHQPPSNKSIYDRQMFISVRNSLNALGKIKQSNKNNYANA